MPRYGVETLICSDASASVGTHVLGALDTTLTKAGGGGVPLVNLPVLNCLGAAVLMFKIWATGGGTGTLNMNNGPFMCWNGIADVNANIPQQSLGGSWLPNGASPAMSGHTTENKALLFSLTPINSFNGGIICPWRHVYIRLSPSVAQIDGLNIAWFPILA